MKEQKRDLPKAARNALSKQKRNLIEDYVALHDIPELGWNLPETTAYIERALGKSHIDYELFESRFPLVSLGRGDVVLLRAEMDALPVAEGAAETVAAGRRAYHYSGHDYHMAMLLSIARVLKSFENDLPCRVLLLFQPAGELGLGAKFLVERGFLERFPVSRLLALHLDPVYPAGQICYGTGQSSAYLEGFFIQIFGKGGRGYHPADAVSPLEIAAQIQLILGSLLQRELTPARRAVLSIGKAGGGAVANQIPDSAVVEGTFRCFGEDVRQYLKMRVGEICNGICEVYRGTCSIDYVSTPAIFNDVQMHRDIFPALEKQFGTLRMADETIYSLGAEDLSYLSAHVPTAFLRLGMGHTDKGTDDMLLCDGAALLLEAFMACAAIT